ncbi:MAG TPA: hypothetical protein VK668_12290 [Mucilaginibacter sp.]|nr:hypothetical protein [Mucilaginibacter sp.]
MKFLKILLIIIVVFIGINLLLNRFFFRSNLDKEAEIVNFQGSQFNFSSSKPFYFEINNELFYNANGVLDYHSTPVWKGNVKEAYISPNGKYALIYDGNKLILIDNTGKQLFDIDNYEESAVEENRKSGRFIGNGIQWSANSDYFLILQDRVWDRNYSKKNRSSIYKYLLADGTFKSLIDLSEEAYECLIISSNEQSIFYEFATKKGDLAFKKVNIKTKKILSEHFTDDSLKLTNVSNDSAYVNYNKNVFQENSFDLKGIIVPAVSKSGYALFYRDQDTTVKLLNGTYGYDGFKGFYRDFFQDGYFLPGNRFFIANVLAKDFKGQMVIDTKTYRIMKLNNQTHFYFNINSKDCRDYVFRWEIMPNVKFSTSVSAQIGKGN